MCDEAEHKLCRIHAFNICRATTTTTTTRTDNNLVSPVYFQLLPGTETGPLFYADVIFYNDGGGYGSDGGGGGDVDARVRPHWECHCRQ